MVLTRHVYIALLPQKAEKGTTTNQPSTEASHYIGIVGKIFMDNIVLYDFTFITKTSSRR